MKRLFALLSCALLGLSLSSHGQPTDNPVASHYGNGQYPAWVDSIQWDNVIDVTSDPALTQVAVPNDDTAGDQNFAAFEEARDILYAEGGGVLYFPAGTYHFSLPDAGYGPGIGPLSRGLMLKEGIVIRGDIPTSANAILRNETEMLDTDHDLVPTTIFAFPFQTRGTVPDNATGVNGEPAGTADAAGEVPTDWNFIGMMPGANETGVSEVDNVGVVNVALVGGTIVFGFDTEWATHMGADGAKWESANFKIDWPAGSAAASEDWINRAPDGQHYMDLINGRTGWSKFVESGSGRLVMNVKIQDGAPWNDMMYVDRKTAATTVMPTDAFAHYRFAGRVIAYGSNVFIANNVIAKPERNFVHVQKQSVGDRAIIFDYANHLGIDINKSLLGGNQGHESVHVLDGDGYYASNIVVRDNWVFNRGNKGYEIAGRHVVIQNNHNERYVAANFFPYEYITNPEAYPAAVEGGDIDAGGISFDGFVWQSAESASDYLSRGYDLGGMDVWVDYCTVINTGSRGNDGEAILGQRHNNIETLSWAITNSKFGPYTIDDTPSSSSGANTGYIGPYDMHSVGLFLTGNEGPGAIGMLKPENNYMLDGTWFNNAGSQNTPATGHSDDWLAPGKDEEPHTDAVAAPELSAEMIPAGDGVALSWVDNAANELGFRVERRIDGGDWQLMAYRPRAAGSAAYADATIGSAVGQFNVGDVVQTQWTDYLVPATGAVDYRVIAINANDDDSTGVSNIISLAGGFGPVSQGFDDLATGALDGQSSWTAPAQATVQAGGVDYIGADGGTISGGTQSLLLDGDPAAKMNDYAVYDLPAAPDQAYFVGMTVLTSEIGVSADPGELFVQLHPNNWVAYAALKFFADSAELPNPGDGGNVLASAGLVADEAYLVVIGVESDGTNVTNLNLWLNPASGDAGTPDLTVDLTSKAIPLSELTVLRVRSQNTATSIDEIMVSPAWSDIVPEGAAFSSITADFEDLTVGEINGQGGWSIDAAHADKANVASGSLTYIAPDGAEVEGASQHLALTGAPAAKMTNFLQLPIDPALDGTTYMRALISSSDKGTSSDPGEIFFRLAGWDLYVAAKYFGGIIELPGDNTLEVDTTNGLPTDVTHMVLLRLNVTGSAVTSVDLWLNPVFGDDTTPDLTVDSLNVDLSAITTLEIRSQNTETQIDEILFAKSWSEMVPEATVVSPPSILSQPLPLSAEVGDPVSFTVSAAGTAPLSYQWRKDGADIDGATGTSYNIATAQLTDAGTYDVVVTNSAGTATSNPAALTVSEPVVSDLVSLFLETFDSGTTEENAAPVDVTTLGWNFHHSYAGVYMPGLATGSDAPNDVLVVQTSASVGDPNAGQLYGYQAFFTNNYPLYGQGEEGARPALPGPHPDTGLYYHNRTLAHFLWKEATITEEERARIREFNFVQGNRDASEHNFFPAVQIDGQWYVYVVSQEFLGTDVRILGRAGQVPNGAETVFSGSQFSENGEFANHYNAQPYSFAWEESGWTPLTFDGGNGTNSTVGMTLGTPLSGELPAGDISALGVYSPEKIDPAYNFNGLRIDSIEVLADAPPQADLFTFTFNNEGTVGGLDRPIQAADWDGIYSSDALPLVTGDAVFADLSEGTSSDDTPGHYKAGFLFVAGKNDQPAPEGFLVYSTNTNVLDTVQSNPNGVNPQTDWYSDPFNSVTDLSELPLGDVQEMQMRIKPRDAGIRFHFAIQVGGEWYISEEALQHSGADLNAWESVSLNVQSANWLSGVVGTDSINFDFTANAPTVVSVADIGAETLIDTVGIYIDTDDGVGANATWARVDSITLSAFVPDLDPPTITANPVDAGVVVDGSADFAVTVLETEGISYQWRKDGVDMAGETGATLSLSNVTAADAGQYDVVVTGPGGSVTSDAATLEVYAAPEVSPLSIDLDASQQDQLVTISANSAISWTAVSNDDWITITFGDSGNGEGLVGITVAANDSTSARTGSLLIAGATVTVEQAGMSLPETFEEIVGATDNGDGSYTSAWFGTYTAPVTDWIQHQESGWLYTGHAALESDMLLYSVQLNSWVWSTVDAWPIAYEVNTDGWIYYIVIDGNAYVYDYATETWSL